MGLCDRVRTSCAAAMERAQLVTIDHDRLASYALELQAEVTEALAVAVPQPSDRQNPERQDPDPDANLALEQSAARVIALDAINFGSGYHDVITKVDGLSGASSMAQRLTEHLATVSSTASELADATPEQCADIFGQSLDNAEGRELMELFARALSELGRFVSAEHDHSFLALVAAADGSAERMAESLLAMPFYRDCATHEGVDVYFYKRAQITAADLARAGHWFDDLAQLTAFADNLVPHVLRLDGVLAVDAELISAIDAGRRLEWGSVGEVELRAAAVVAIERLRAEFGIHRPEARAMDIDLALWLRGSGAVYKARPRHRTRCVYY